MVFPSMQIQQKGKLDTNEIHESKSTVERQRYHGLYLKLEERFI